MTGKGTDISQQTPGPCVDQAGLVSQKSTCHYLPSAGVKGTRYKQIPKLSIYPIKSIRNDPNVGPTKNFSCK